jgi:sirohydrochlorin ferrochelatase
MQQTPNARATADASYASARIDSDRLNNLIESGQGSQEDVAAYQTASAALASATSQRQDVLDAVFAAATANLTSNQRTALTNQRTNASWNLSREFLVVNREQTEWVSLRDALAIERIAAKLGESPDAGAQAQLANWRAHGSVAAARTGLNESLTQIRTNWNSAAGGN